jgi:virginiamycin B lyase
LKVLFRMAERRSSSSNERAIVPIACLLSLAACSAGGRSGGLAAAVPSAVGNAIEVVQKQPPSQILKFPLLTSNAGPNAVALGADSNYWVTEGSVGQIARVTNTGAVSEFPFTLSHAPSYVAKGVSPYVVWTADTTDGVISGISAAGVPKEVALAAGSSPVQSYDDASNDVWFPEASANTSAVAETIGANFANKTTKVTTYALPTGANPSSIVQGPDNNMWVSEPGLGAIAKVAHSGGAVTQYPLPSGRTPTTIIKFAGALWFGESTTTSTAYLARMTTAGALTEYATLGNVVPEYLVAGPLSGIWYCTTSAQLAYAVPATNSISFKKAVATFGAPEKIIEGNDGNIWYSDPADNSVDIYVVYPLTVTPGSIAFTALTQTQTFSAKETNYTGTFYVTDSNSSVASITQSSGKTFMVTANAVGTATLTVSDNAKYPSLGNGTTISVTVTTTSISVN